MNNKKRNQLIGFIVLLLLALFVGPYIMTDKSTQVESSIPLLPSNHDSDNELFEYIDDLSISDPTIVDDEINGDMQLATPQDQSETTEIPNSNYNPQNEKNYVIQLVALKNKHKIEELVALLRLNNYDVYTEPQIPQADQLTRLFVGYYPTKEQADVVIIDLQNLTKLKGFAVAK